MKKTPRSPFDTLGGLVYLPRLLDKIRLKLRDELSEYYFEMLGKGFDGRLCQYLGVEYDELVAQVESGASDAELLLWIQESGLSLNQERVDVWNGFATKRGWNDSGTPTLIAFKQERGLSDRADIQTFFEFMEVDEKRAS